MGWVDWFSLASICALGAMSPGPSLALLVRSTIRGGRAGGVAMAIAHACGIGLYALGVALGLAVLVTNSPALFRGLQLGGAAFLLWLGIQGLRSTGQVLNEAAAGPALGVGEAARSGFLIAFLNPKIAIWFLALFSQFVSPESGSVVRSLMALLASVIDGAWYVFVALTLSTGPLLGWLRRNARRIDRVFGLILIAVAVRVALL